MQQEPSEITIGDAVYKHVKTREYTPVSVYTSGSEYLRIGPKDVLGPELELHKKLLSFGFPVPALTSEGEHDGRFYYTEESAGDTLLGDLFWEDCKKDGQISPENFSSLLRLSEKFAAAQLRTVSSERDDQAFYIGIHMDYLQEELPELKTDMLAAFEKLKARTTALPVVLTHGDFNAYNLFKGGVIDFGSIHYAPAGYDIIGNIYHTYNFPKAGDYESVRRYHFSPDQITEYMEAMDRIYVAAGLPKASEYREDYIWAKSVWSTSRMQRSPKLQQWRYNRFKRLLLGYIHDQPILQAALED